MEERWLVSIAPKKSDSGIYLSKIELFILRLPYNSGSPFTEEGELTNEGGGGLCVIHPAAPWRKQIGSSLEGNRIINPHSRIPK